MNDINVNDEVLHSTIDENDELYHHGIKGMKWGRRRFQNSDGSLTKAGRKRYADDYDEYDSRSDEARDHDNLRRKGVSGMSNAELKRYTERARLENDVHNAQQQEQQRTSKFQKFMGKLKATNELLSNVARLTSSVRAISSNTQALYKDGKAATDWFKNRNKKDVDIAETVIKAKDSINSIKTINEAKNDIGSVVDTVKEQKPIEKLSNKFFSNKNEPEQYEKLGKIDDAYSNNIKQLHDKFFGNKGNTSYFKSANENLRKQRKELHQKNRDLAKEIEKEINKAKRKDDTDNLIDLFKKSKKNLKKNDRRSIYDNWY